MKKLIILSIVLISVSFIAQAQRRPSNIISPEILPDNSVIFRILAPNATKVSVVGTWSRGFKPNEMIKKDSVFEVKVGLIPSDMYEYDIIVDGLPMLDPLNKNVTRDGAWIQSHKAAKAALKAAKKILSPYLLEEIEVKTKSQEKEIKHKKDTDVVTRASKKEKVKKTIVITKATQDVEEVAVMSDVPQTAKIVEKKPSTSVRKAKPSVAEVNDLTLIEGIGSRIAAVLNENGIQNFKQLASSSADDIKDILKNKRLGFADPSTWAEQAQLAVNGKLEELEILKKELKHGRRQ